MSSLFRRESQAERERAWLGRIVLIRPLTFATLTWCSVTIAVALVALFAFGEYTRKARLTGVLAPVTGTARVVAQQAGRIEAVHVREGDQVRKDDILLLVGDGRSRRHAGGIAHELDQRMEERDHALRRQLEFFAEALRTEQAALDERVRGLRREREAAGAELEALRRREALAQRSLDRARELGAIGFVSSAAIDRENDATLDASLRIESSRRTRLALDREIAALEHERRAAQSRAQAQMAGIRSQLAAAGHERVERDLQYRAAIAAPSSGFVAALLVEPGHTIAPGTALATIVPVAAPLEAHLYAPSRAIGFVRPGQEVALRYTAYPHQKFGSHRAIVTAVSRSPLAASDLGFVPPDGSREPLYRIKVALERQAVSAYGRRESLQAGMQVEADVLLDRRRLIEWVFEPLLSLAGRV
jgi:membrane fusion protein